MFFLCFRKLKLSDSNSPMKKTKQTSPNVSQSLNYSIISSDEDALTDKVKDISISETDNVVAPQVSGIKKDNAPVNDSVIIVDDSEDELPPIPTKRSKQIMLQTWFLRLEKKFFWNK